MPTRLLALVFLAVTACGSGDSGSPQSSSSSSPSGTTMTTAAYVSAANAICADVNTRMEAVAEPTSADSFVSSMNALLTLMDQGQAKLRALVPPAELRADVEANLLGPNDQQSATLRAALPKVEAAVTAQDAMTAAQEFAKAFEDMEKVAEPDAAWFTSVGLTECSS